LTDHSEKAKTLAEDLDALKETMRVNEHRLQEERKASEASLEHSMDELKADLKERC